MNNFFFIFLVIQSLDYPYQSNNLKFNRVWARKVGFPCFELQRKIPSFEQAIEFFSHFLILGWEKNILTISKTLFSYV